MANDIRDLGIKERLTIRPNWQDKNQVELITSRDFASFPTTITDIFLFSQKHKTKFTFKYTCENKSSEYDIINFFSERKGRFERFWIQGYREEFILSRNITLNDTIIYVEDNGLNLVYQGYERFYIELLDEDLITRKITNISKVGNELLLTVSAMDRNILKTDIGIFGRMYLVRFEKDVLEVISKTTKVSEVILNFMEVVTEYDI